MYRILIKGNFFCLETSVITTVWLNHYFKIRIKSLECNYVVSNSFNRKQSVRASSICLLIALIWSLSKKRKKTV